MNAYTLNVFVKLRVQWQHGVQLWLLRSAEVWSSQETVALLFSFIFGVDHSGDGAFVDWIFTLELKQKQWSWNDLKMKKYQTILFGFGDTFPRTQHGAARNYLFINIFIISEQTAMRFWQ